jgi:fumarate reductase flavoprotein subunit
MSQKMNRRSFLKTAALTGVVATGVGLVGCSSKEPAGAAENAKPDAGTGASTGGGGYVQASANITPVAEEFVIKPVKASEVTADETHDADYLVIGSGNCGLLSAARAAEQGLKVILLEKASETGGSSFGTEAHFALDSTKYVKEQGMVTWTPKEAADYFNLYNEFHSSQTLVMSFLNHCNEPFDWWIDKGAKVNQLLMSLAGPNTGAGMFFEGKAKALADLNRQVIEEHGATVLSNTRATNLIVDDDGSVVGALAEGENGVVAINAKATFVGTGGFGTNPDMVNAYLGARGNAAIVGDAMLYHNGDGINMMLGVGAITGILDSVQPGGLQVANTDYEGDVTRAGAEPFLWVNKFGQRVGCEFWTNPTYGYSLAAWSPDYYFYSIFDQSLIKRMETEQFFCPSRYLPYTYDPVPDMQAQMDEGVSQGAVIKADTLQELASQAGISEDAFKATVDEYNAICAAGNDHVFYKDPSMLLPISTPPYYALKLECNRLSSLCGVMIDADCKVLDKDGAWIKGLFAGGLDSAGFFMADYNHAFSGSCSSYSFFTGFHSADMAVKFIQG